MAVLAGYVVGSTINMALIQLKIQKLYPPAEGIDVADPAQLNSYHATLPGAAFLLIMFAHLAQSFTGAWVAARFSESHTMILALSIGVLSLAGGIMAMTVTEGPGWLLFELPLYLVLAWAAGKMELNRREEQSN